MVGNASICAVPHRRLGLGGGAPRRVAGDRHRLHPAGRVLRGPGDPALPAGRGRHAPTSRRRRGSARSAASPTRSGSRTSSGRARGQPSPRVGTTRPRRLGTDGRRADQLLRPARLPARHPQRAVRRRRDGRADDAGADGRVRLPRDPRSSADRLVATAGIDALEGRGASGRRRIPGGPARLPPARPRVRRGDRGGRHGDAPAARRARRLGRQRGRDIRCGDTRATGRSPVPRASGGGERDPVRRTSRRQAMTSSIVVPKGSPPPRSRRIGFVSTRFAGTDGVSLETAKWATVLERLGPHLLLLRRRAATGRADRSRVVPQAFYRHPEIDAINAVAYPAGTAARRGPRRVRRSGRRGIAARPAGRRDRPHPRPAGAPQGRAARVRRPVRPRAPRDRERQRHPAQPAPRPRDLRARRGDRASRSSPTTTTSRGSASGSWSTACRTSSRRPSRRAIPPIRHVVINSVQARELASRNGLTARVIPNVMDFEVPPDAARRPRRPTSARTSASPPGDLLLLQPTRVIQRKGIEHAIELTRRLGRPATPRHLARIGRRGPGVRAAGAGVRRRCSTCTSGSRPR